MVESGERFGLALEAFHAFGIGGDGLVQDLDGHFATELRVLGAIHLSHASCTEGGDHFIVAETSTCF